MSLCDLCHFTWHYGTVVISHQLYWNVWNLPKRPFRVGRQALVHAQLMIGHLFADRPAVLRRWRGRGRTRPQNGGHDAANEVMRSMKSTTGPAGEIHSV
jgi:hypothetical protein